MQQRLLVSNQLFKHYRRAAHVQGGMELARMRRVATGDQVLMEEQLAVKYLLAELDEAKWRQQLQRLEKSRNKCASFVQVIDMFVQASASVINTHMSGKQPIQSMLAQLDELYAYAKSAVADVSKRYQCVAPSVFD